MAATAECLGGSFLLPLAVDKLVLDFVWLSGLGHQLQVLDVAADAQRSLEQDDACVWRLAVGQHHEVTIFGHQHPTLARCIRKLMRMQRALYQPVPPLVPLVHQRRATVDPSQLGPSRAHRSNSEAVRHAWLSLTLRYRCAHFLSEWRHIRLRACLNIRRLVLNFAVNLILVLVVIQEGCVHLGEVQRWIYLAHQLFGRNSLLVRHGNIVDGNSMPRNAWFATIDFGVADNVLDVSCRADVRSAPIRKCPRSPRHSIAYAGYSVRSSRCSPKTRRRASLISPRVA